MNELIQELKIRARKRHKSLLAGDRTVFERLQRRFPKASEYKLKHSLHLVAYENGFGDWPMALRYLSGASDTSHDSGSFWYAHKCMTLLNHWFANYNEAEDFCANNEALCLVPYKHQFIVVDENYLSMIGCEHKAVNSETRDLVASYGSESWRLMVRSRMCLTN